MHFPKEVWDGIGPRRKVGQYASPGPEDWDQVATEVTAIQKALDIESKWPQRDQTSFNDAIKAELRVRFLELQEESVKSRRAGLSDRSVSVPLPAVNPNGTIDFGIWIPPASKCKLTQLSVAYKTAPASAGGTIVLDVFVAPAVTVQKTAAFDLEAVGPTNLDLSAPTIQPGDYLFGTITSDNADATDGTGGILTLTYTICK